LNLHNQPKVRENAGFPPRMQKAAYRIASGLNLSFGERIGRLSPLFNSGRDQFRDGIDCASQKEPENDRDPSIQR
jgi:hypothetical protein